MADCVHYPVFCSIRLGDSASQVSNAEEGTHLYHYSLFYHFLLLNRALGCSGLQ